MGPVEGQKLGLVWKKTIVRDLDLKKILEKLDVFNLSSNSYTVDK